MEKDVQPEGGQGCFNRDRQAYAVLLSAGWFFVGGYTLGAESNELNIGTVNFWRGFSTVLLNFLIIRMQGRSLEFRNRLDLSLLNWRSVYCSIHGLMISIALYYLPPPIVHTINASGPIIVFVIDYFRNGTAVVYLQLLGIFIATLGLLLTINAVMIL
jgi:drug/metabolite transporter (DMT)-like permease